MKWTKELPSRDGWYWWRGSSALKAQVVFVLRGRVMLAGLSAKNQLSELGGEWGDGPIPEPGGEAGR